MPGGGNTQTVQKADPWVGAQPGLSTLYGNATALATGPGQQYYSGSTVAPQSDATQGGLNALQATATTPSWNMINGLQQAALTSGGNYLNANPASAGLGAIGNTDYASNTPAMQTLLGYGSSSALNPAITQGLMSLSQRNFGNIAGGNQLLGMGGDTSFMGSNAGTRGLANTASGAYLNSNPYIDAMFGAQASQVGRQFANSVMPNIASMYSSAGRYGSGAMGEGLGQAQQEFGRTLNNLAANTYGQNYANERQLQQGAQQSLGSFGLQDIAQRIAALSQAGNEDLTLGGQKAADLTQAGTLGLQDRSQQQSALSSFNASQLQGRQQQLAALTAQGSLFDQERQRMMQASALTPQLEAARYLAPSTLLSVGGQRDAYAQSLINADKARFDFGQQQPYQQLQFLNSIMNGIPFNNTTTSTSGGTNPLLQGLGLANAGAATFRNLAPLFSSGAGAAGAAGGLFAGTTGLEGMSPEVLALAGL